MTWADITEFGLLKDGGVYQIGVITPPDWTAVAIKSKFETAPPGLPGGVFSVDTVTPGTVSGAIKSWRFLGTWHGSSVVVSRKPADAPDVQYVAVFEFVPDPPPPPKTSDVTSVSSSGSAVWSVLGVLAAAAALGGVTYFAFSQKHVRLIGNPVIEDKQLRILRIYGDRRQHRTAGSTTIWLLENGYLSEGQSGIWGTKYIITEQGLEALRT